MRHGYHSRNCEWRELFPKRPVIGASMQRYPSERGERTRDVVSARKGP